jgi:hypothetical protein
MNLLQPLNDRNAVQLRIALRSAVPGSIKVGLRSTSNGWRAMVVVHYQVMPYCQPDAKPYRRWFKLSGVSIGYDDDPERPTRMAAILAEAEAIVETERARLAAHEAKK